MYDGVDGDVPDNPGDSPCSPWCSRVNFTSSCLRAAGYRRRRAGTPLTMRGKTKKAAD